MKLLICAGGLPYAEPTIRFAGLIARLTEARVTIINVTPQDGSLRLAQDAISRAQVLLPDVAAEIKIRKGKPAEQIVAELRSGDYDLVVMGEHMGGPGDLFLSPLIHDVSTKTCLPLLVVKTERDALRRILICIAGTRGASRVLEMSTRLAAAAGAEVTLLHVVSPLPSMYTGLSGMEETLDELLRSDSAVARRLRRSAALLHDCGLTAQIKLRQGVATHEILEEAQAGDYDLIVVGSRRRSGVMRSLFTGDVARVVVDNASRPVLSICTARRRRPS